MASYRAGVEWIALNDEPQEMDLEAISGYISTILLAVVFDKNIDKVAQDVLRFREREGI